ncbi:rab-GTPase-TBC domain-containing protein [Tricharina praecox]|uniref:rab-GTPase-TBC domain-containing protein n=1 Tax=Tricharina praecox TaxID=43433 RepID=UPI00221F10A0|nr:rab-GTPase-TBC domain-containing protein [Tricharina praecox]KAI5843197.1 rab-GTPase-TBC domain-containing protein [Tricharina praecox]
MASTPAGGELTSRATPSPLSKSPSISIDDGTGSPPHVEHDTEDPQSNDRRSVSPKSTAAGIILKDSIVTSSQLHSPLTITTPVKQPANGPRSALFDDHVASAHVPGSLHLAPDSTIQRLVERQGYVTLIRQLAEDLAHRDRELVSFRRRAEERERTLKRMLVEVEVSNADIEKRLANCAIQRDSSRDPMRNDGDETSYTESIDEMMHQALGEEDAFSIADDASGLNIYMDDDGMKEDTVTPRSTLRVPPAAAASSAKIERDTDSVSLNSNASRKSSTRGWKGWIVGQGAANGRDEDTKRARKMSVAGGTVKRTSISPETSNLPPGEASPIPRSSSRASLASMRSTSANINQKSGRVIPAASIYTQHHFASDQSKAPSQTESETASAAQRRSSNSVAHWALRLVSQTPPADQPEPPTSPTRRRSLSTSEGPMESSKRRGSTSTGDSLQRVKARNSVAAPGRGRAPSTTFFQDLRDTAERIVPLSQSKESKKPSDEAGPVEMDMIVPHESQPPTLLQGWNQEYSHDFLTDRFGFIYDKKQRSVSIKGANSIEGSYTERKQSDESAKNNVIPEEPMETCTSPELDTTLSEWSETIYGPSSFSVIQHPPLPPSAPRLLTKPADGSKPAHLTTSLVERLSRPSAAISSPTTATNAVSEASLAIRPQITPVGTSTAEESTVRLLLGQLSDLHDSLQHDRSLKWNEFLRKVRTERRKGDDEENGMPETQMADGELIGVATLGTEGRGGKQRWKEFSNLVLGGIPVAFRWKIWTECSGATAMKVPGYYDDLLQNGHDDPIVISQIAMDINRTLTDNIFFRKGPGVSKLKQILLAYSRRNPEVGYCQGMNMIAASLLLIMPSEEDAFWVLCSIVERILPKTYFEPNLLASRADQEVLKHFVATILPSLHTHLLDLGVELEALTFQWFLSIFTDTLAAEALFRVWDVILCVAGSVFLFQVAIALLRLNEKALLRCESAAEVYSYLNGGMIHQGISIDGLIRESDGLKNLIRKPEVDKRREMAVKKELGGETMETERSNSTVTESDVGPLDVDGAGKRPLAAIADEGESPGVAASTSREADGVS